MITVVNFKTDKMIKTQAQKIAGDMGLNLSDILNVYLRSFVRKKELHIDLQDESNPSDEFLEAIKEAEEEYKNGKITKFKSIDDIVAHLKQI